MDSEFKTLSNYIDFNPTSEVVEFKKGFISGFFSVDAFLFYGKLENVKLIEIKKEEFHEIDWIRRYFHEIDLLYFLSFEPEKIYYLPSSCPEGNPLVFELQNGKVIIFAPYIVFEEAPDCWERQPCYYLLD